MKCIYLRIWFFSERECRYVCFPLMHSTIIEWSEFTRQIIHVRHARPICGTPCLFPLIAEWGIYQWFKATVHGVQMDVGLILHVQCKSTSKPPTILTKVKFLNFFYFYSWKLLFMDYTQNIRVNGYFTGRLIIVV